MIALETHDLTVTYRKRPVLYGIDVAVPEGNLVGIVGPNGAGKTTTINMLCTLLRPTAGAATLNGFDVQQDRSDVRRSIGLVSGSVQTVVLESRGQPSPAQRSRIEDLRAAAKVVRGHKAADGVSANSW